MRSAEVRLEGGRIVRVQTDQRTYRVQSTLEHWRAGMRWWRGEWPREYFWLETSEGVVLEVYVEVFAWTLAAIQD